MRLGAEERPVQGDGEHVAPFGERYLGERVLAPDAGVAHQHVDAPEGVDGGVGHSVRRRLVGHVGQVGEAPPPGGGDFAGHRLGGLAVAQRIYQDGRPFAAQRKGDLAPDIARRAGDHGHLAGQCAGFLHRTILPAGRPAFSPWFAVQARRSSDSQPMTSPALRSGGKTG